VHPFRFGVMASWAASGDAWATLARRAETLGYDILLTSDHLGRQLSPVAALTAAAMAATQLRVGSYVFANDFRDPLVLAREAATIDLLSGGRFELGLGAGWRTGDYRSLGRPYEAPGRRIDRLEEVVPVLKRLLAGETVDHVGTRYHFEGATIGLTPAQRPRLPLMIAGGGPRILRIAAREADIVAMQPQFSLAGRPMIRQATEAETARKIAIIREAAGAGFDSLVLNVIVADAALVGGGRPIPETAIAAIKAIASGVVSTPYLLYGTRAGLRRELERRRDRLGITYYAIPGSAMEAMAPLVEAMAGR
jgi:probable F420-dependent oxidoreductase